MTMPISAPEPETLASFIEHQKAKMEKPMFMIGQGALAREDGLAILALAAKAARPLGALKEGWNGFAVLHTAAARVGALDLGFVPGQGGLDASAMSKAGALDVLYNLGADEIDVAPGAFVIYQGSHGDRGAARADVILPGAAYTGKIRPLREYRRPRPAGGPGQFSSRRRARGLGHPPRLVRRARPAVAVRFAESLAHAPLCRASAFWANDEIAPTAPLTRGCSSPPEAPMAMRPLSPLSAISI